MNWKTMLKTPIEKRRGSVDYDSLSSTYLLIDKPADDVLDQLLAGKIIGAARRDCLADIRAGRVPRPIGTWCALVRLKGQRWTYLIGGDFADDTARQWAAAHGWRTASFSTSDIGSKSAQLFEGKREVFSFLSGMCDDPEPGYLYRDNINDDDEIVMIRGEAEVCTDAWLSKLKTGAQGFDLLARFADAYLPLGLYCNSENGKAIVGGCEGKPHADEEDELEQFPDSAFERVDIFTFGAADTLEPTLAAIALSAAVRAGDANAAQQAIAQGANPNLMCDDDAPPLEIALNLGSPYLNGLHGGRFDTISRQQQLDLLEVLLKAGATPEPAGRNPAIHWALHWAERGDERTIVNQLRVLLKHGANPNAAGTFLRGNGQTPLHSLVLSDQWLAVAKLLVQHGADLHATNHAGQTARELADAQIADLQKKLSDRPASDSGAPLGEASLAALFTQGLMGGENKQQSAMKKLAAGMMSAQSDEYRKRLAKLEPLAAFLRQAEAGSPDFSDIDAIADATTHDYDEEHKKRKKEVDKATAVLGGAMDQLTAQLRDIQK